MAPEILRGEKYDFKVDIFAAGVIAIYLFSGGYTAFEYIDEETDLSTLPPEEAKAIIKQKILDGDNSWE